jgi:hypothetical protein
MLEVEQGGSRRRASEANPYSMAPRAFGRRSGSMEPAGRRELGDGAAVGRPSRPVEPEARRGFRRRAGGRGSPTRSPRGAGRRPDRLAEVGFRKVVPSERTFVSRIEKQRSRSILTALSQRFSSTPALAWEARKDSRVELVEGLARRRFVRPRWRVEPTGDQRQPAGRSPLQGRSPTRTPTFRRRASERTS